MRCEKWAFLPIFLFVFRFLFCFFFYGKMSSKTKSNKDFHIIQISLVGTVRMKAFTAFSWKISEIFHRPAKKRLAYCWTNIFVDFLKHFIVSFHMQCCWKVWRGSTLLDQMSTWHVLLNLWEEMFEKNQQNYPCNIRAELCNLGEFRSLTLKKKNTTIQ